MSTCGSCKYWTVPAESDESRAPENDDYDWVESEFGTCGAVKFQGRETQSDDRSLAGVTDGSGYRAALRCRSAFGCVLFEPKGDVS